VVFTGDWIPDHELARAGGVVLDAGTRGPQVDLGLRTSQAGVFAAGNLLHGAEVAGVAAIEGQVAARSIRRFLDDGGWPAAVDRVVLEVESPLRWVFPNVLAPRFDSTGGVAMPPGRRFVLRVDRPLRGAQVEVRCGGRLLHSERAARLIPNRPIHLDAAWTAQVAAGGPGVTLTVRD
jgi:hypothetical protein